MDAVLLPVLALGGLVGLGWLAARAGVDSRDWPLSEEERLAQHGYAWGDAVPVAHPMTEHAWSHLADLRREAVVERLARAAAQERAERSAGGRSAMAATRARLAAGLVRLAARVDRAGTLDGAARQLERLPNC